MSKCEYCGVPLIDAEDWRDHQPCPELASQPPALQARIRGLEAENERLKKSNLRYFEDSEKDMKDCEYLHEQIERLKADLAMYKKLYTHAIDCVDKVFQEDSKNKAMLPDFLGLGECKFRGVIKLAEAYLASRT